MTKSWRQEKNASAFFEISHHEGKSGLEKSQRLFDLSILRVIMVASLPFCNFLVAGMSLSNGYPVHR